MSLIALNPQLEALALEADRQFRRITAGLFVPTLIFAIGVQFIHVSIQRLPTATPEGERYARLLEELEKPPAPPLPEPEPEAQAKPEPIPPAPKKTDVAQPAPKPGPKKPEPSAEQRAQAARNVAARSGLLAFSDQLADLRKTEIPGGDSGQPLQTAGVLSSSVGRGSGPAGEGSSMFTAAVNRGSGGIGEGGYGNASTGQPGPAMGGRGSSRVSSSIGGGGGSGPGGSGKGAIGGRSLEEIQLIFDRNKGSIYTIYNRALRDNPSLRGKLLVNLTIAPDGAVTHCSIISSELNDGELDRKIVARVLLLNFGSKPVPPVTLDYPIYFLPS